MHVVQDVSAMVHKTCQNMSSLRDRQQFTQLSDLGRSLGRSNEDIKNSIARLNSTLDSSLDSWTKKSELGNELAGQVSVRDAMLPCLELTGIQCRQLKSWGP